MTMLLILSLPISFFHPISLSNDNLKDPIPSLVLGQDFCIGLAYGTQSLPSTRRHFLSLFL